MNQPSADPSIKTMSPWVYRGMAWALISVLLAIAAPYGKQIEYHFLPRLGYWLSVNGMAILLAVLVRHVIQRRCQSNGLGVLMATAIAQTLVLGPAIWLANVHVFRFASGTLVWLAEISLIVLIVCLCVAMIRYELGKMRDFVLAEVGGLSTVGHAAPYRPAFLDRADPPLEGEVLSVSAADHYLDVVTSAGRGRVLMRFRDALEDLEAVPGFRIHRSHWVAVSELARVWPEGRRYQAELASGAVLPVSMAYVEDLRRLGLVEDCATGKRITTPPTNMISAPGDIRRVSSGRS